MSTQWFATCPKGLESLLAAELSALGASSVRETVAGVAVEASDDFGYRACLGSRLASRVLKPLASFAATDSDALYAGMRGVDWSAHLTPDDTLAIDARGTTEALTHTQFIAQRAKDAIVDHFRELGDSRPSVDLQQPKLRLNLNLARGQARVAIDFSGTPLHQRGWRVAQGQAPLKENLAAAMLLRARWPEISAEGGALVDPFCGAGTLMIEGIWMAANVAPGLEREHFGFLGWRGFEPAIWDTLRAEAREKADAGLRVLEPRFFGFDHDPQAINATRVNAQRAGVAGFLTLRGQAIATLNAPPGAKPGLVIGNPPYGQRLGESETLKPLYGALGERLKSQFAGWRAAIITSDPELGFAMHLKAARRYQLMNGAIACQLLCFDELTAGGRAPARAPKPLSPGAEALANRLRKNLKQLKRWREREGVSCYRVYDADLPEYSAAIDLWHGVVEDGDAAASDWLTIQEYRAPATIPADVAQLRLAEIVRVASDVLAVPRAQIALKQRAPQTRSERYARHDVRERFLIVDEGGLRFRVNLFDWLDTGLFLDHRPMRALIRSEAAGRRFLNLFAYTGSATVYAAAGGARATTSVDLSRTYLEWAERNLALNRLTGLAHRFELDDAMTWLAAERGSYDLIFCDPPTFSNSKSADDFDVQRDHPQLLALCMARLAPAGMLLFSSNLRRFKLAPQVSENWQVRDISRATLPPDFKRDARIHHAFVITHAQDSALSSPDDVRVFHESGA